MSECAVRAQSVFKKFRRGDHADSLRDLLAGWLDRQFKPASLRSREFWALQDVSFEVRPGEAFGVIGPNGAGKSTLLKLLAGIMRPNGGSISLERPVSALIELGAGFHGDLTGLENIFLNAAILGMPRREVVRKLDEIVAFADIGDFLSMPVKHYSSGMQARLGFAIAAHVDARVMLVDEVLSVGDRVFRGRCMERMRAALQQGVSIVFVSHDLNAVQQFCDRVLVLSTGRPSFLGAASEAIGHYYEACVDPWLMDGVKESPVVHIRNLRLLSAHGRPVRTLTPGEEACLEFEAAFDVDMENPSFGLSLIRTDDHLTIFETSSSRLGIATPAAASGQVQRVRYRFTMNVAPGEYVVGLHVRDRDATVYALEMAHALRVRVSGLPTTGGVAHLRPTLDVTPAEIFADKSGPPAAQRTAEPVAAEA